MKCCNVFELVGDRSTEVRSLSDWVPLLILCLLIDPKDGISDLVTKAERFKRPQRGGIEKDLAIAMSILEQARSMLLHSGITDPCLNLKVYFRLMTVALDLAHDGEWTIDCRLNQHRLAEEYGVRAMTAARMTGNASKMAQVRLEQTFWKGREAELEDKRVTDPWEIRRVKDEALKEMRIAMEELKVSDRDKFERYKPRVSNWQKRLSGP